MELLNKLEDTLAGWYKNAPKLSDASKKSIVGFWPVVALVFGILQLLAAWGLWHWGHLANNVVNLANSYLGTNYGIHHLNIFYWLSFLVLLADAVLLLMAYPGLQKRLKSGWNFLFYGALLNAVYGIVSAFNNYGGSSSLVLQLIVSAVVLYFLFQIRDQYRVSGSASKTPAS